MNIREVNPITVLYTSYQTTYANMMQYVRVVARDLYQYAGEQNLEITGPIYWIYYGSDGNPETEFTLEIALPVTSTTLDNDRFSIKTLEPFKCVNEVLYGSWANIPAVYTDLISGALEAKYELSGITREVYINMDFLNSDNNITEVQLGIK